MQVDSYQNSIVIRRLPAYGRPVYADTEWVIARRDEGLFDLGFQ